MSSLSCHILDTTRGMPAESVSIELLAFGDKSTIAKEVTNGDGRARFDDVTLAQGTYTLRFHTKSYCEENFGEAFFPLVEVHFSVGEEERHFHIPLLLSPYSYSTYRGS